MKKDFSDPTKIEFPLLDGEEEEVVGVHASGIKLVEGLNTSNSRNYCSNCKRKIHCYVKVDRRTKEAVIHKTCKNDDCECKCKTHYACKLCGHLHPYGQKCNKPEIIHQINPKSDIIFNKIIKDYRKSQELKQSNIQKEKSS